MKHRGTMYSKNVSLVMFMGQEENDRCSSQRSDPAHTVQTSDYGVRSEKNTINNVTRVFSHATASRDVNDHLSTT